MAVVLGCSMDLGYLCRGKGRHELRVLGRELLQCESVRPVVGVDVFCHHSLDLRVLALERLEGTMHNKMLDGEVRCIDLSCLGHELKLPLASIPHVLEIHHVVQSVQSA